MAGVLLFWLVYDRKLFQNRATKLITKSLQNNNNPRPTDAIPEVNRYKGEVYELCGWPNLEERKNNND